MTMMLRNTRGHARLNESNQFLQKSSRVDAWMYAMTPLTTKAVHDDIKSANTNNLYRCGSFFMLLSYQGSVSASWKNPPVGPCLSNVARRNEVL